MTSVQSHSSSRRHLNSAGGGGRGKWPKGKDFLFATWAFVAGERRSSNEEEAKCIFPCKTRKRGGSVCFDFDPLLSRAKASLSKTLFCDIFIFLCPLNEREGERTRERRGKHPTLSTTILHLSVVYLREKGAPIDTTKFHEFPSPLLHKDSNFPGKSYYTSSPPDPIVSPFFSSLSFPFFLCPLSLWPSFFSRGRPLSCFEVEGGIFYIPSSSSFLVAFAIS